MIFLIFALSLWYAWRYSRTEIDPDWAMFNLEGFTGARYGKDFIDCKSPLIHYWYRGIAKMVGKDVKRVKFAHHFLISIPGFIIGGWQGLAFVALVNSGWLYAFHGNVGQQAVGLIMLSLFAQQEWISTALLFAAVAFEPKLVSVLVIPLLHGWYLPFTLLSLTGISIALLIRFYAPQYWGWLWEANIVVPKRMTEMRRKLLKNGVDYINIPSQGMLFILPWLWFAIVNRPDVLYWLPLFLYMLLMIVGIAVRSNHFIPLAAWIALALPQTAIYGLLATEILSGMFYLPDIWRRYYPRLANINQDAKAVGEWLRDKPGRLWVNGLHTGIYIYSGKPPFGGMTEQIEIRENVHERREAWRNAFKASPPEWVVVGFEPGWNFEPIGYNLVAKTMHSNIYRRS